jgi:putative transposase
MPQGRGKQERLNRVIRERFVLEACQAGIPSMSELNDRFTAWAAQMLNTRVHTETGQTPLARFVAAGAPPVADPALLADAFRWAAVRVVTRTATVSLAGNRYSVDPALVGRRVELRYDPEDLSLLTVHFNGRFAGTAEPLIIGRHVHPRVPQAQPDTAAPTGIDYLGLVLAAHDHTNDAIAYRHVPLFDPDPDDDDDDDDGAAGVPAVTR